MSNRLVVALESSFSEETDAISVVVSVVDQAFDLVGEPRTVPIGSGAEFDVPAGTYAVHVETPSGDTLRQLAMVQEGAEPTRARFSLHLLSGHETLERTALLKGMTRRPMDEGLDADAYESAWAKLWRREPEGSWRVAPFEPAHSWTFRDGVRHVFSLPPAQHVIQIGGREVGWRFISIPAHEQVSITILPDREREGELDVSAATSHDSAESLLGFMMAGKLDLADRVLAQAEHLLFGKYEDPLAATVAGYYLLRVGRLRRLQSWGSNLSGSFKWLPDGAVINAWQLIQTGRKTGADRAFDAAREQLLLAASRGTPVYTEGLRLLVDGLALYDGNDVAAALDGVRRFADATDWSQATVTYTGTDPDRPEPKVRAGMPRSTAGMVFLHRVELSDLVRVGAIEPDTTVEFRPEPTMKGVVTEHGTLKLAQGVAVRTAEATDFEPQAGPSWYSWTTPDGTTLADRAHGVREQSVRASLGDPIKRLGLSSRTENVLIRSGIDDVRELLGSLDTLGEVRGIGERSLDEIASSLNASGLVSRPIHLNFGEDPEGVRVSSGRTNSAHEHEADA